MAMPKNIPQYVLTAFYQNVLSCVTFKDGMSKKSKADILATLKQVVLLDIHAFGFFSYTEQAKWNCSRQDYDRVPKIDMSIYLTDGVKLDFDLYITQEQLNEIFTVFYTLLGDLLITGEGGKPIKLSKAIPLSNSFERFLVTNEFIEYRLPRHHIRKEIEMGKEYFNRDAELKKKHSKAKLPIIDNTPISIEVVYVDDVFNTLMVTSAAWRLTDPVAFQQIKETIVNAVSQKSTHLFDRGQIEKIVQEKLEGLMPRNILNGATSPIFNS